MVKIRYIFFSIQILFPISWDRIRICNFLNFVLIFVLMNQIGKWISEICFWYANFLLIFLKYFSRNVDEKIFPSSDWNIYSTEEEEIFICTSFLYMLPRHLLIFLIRETKNEREMVNSSQDDNCKQNISSVL